MTDLKELYWGQRGKKNESAIPVRSLTQFIFSEYFIQIMLNHPMPQSGPLKNRVMIIIHFIFFPVIISFTLPLKPSGRFGCEAADAGGVRCDYCNEDSSLEKENLPYVK